MGKRLDILPFSDIEELLRQGRFIEAKSALERCKISTLDESNYAYFCILSSEVSFSLGDYHISEILNNAIKYYKYSNDNQNYAKAKYLYGRMQAALGDYVAAKEAFLESYASYKRCDNLEGEAIVLNRIAYIASLAGEIGSAISSIKRCIYIYEELNNRQKVIYLSNNLALVYFLSGAIGDSVDLYESTHLQINDLGSDSICRHNLRYSLAMAHKGDAGKSLELISTVYSLVSDIKRERAQYYEYLGWIYILDNNFKEAEKALLAGLELSLKIAPESALISQTKRLLADAYIGLKKYDLAQKYAEEGLAVAERINERAEIAGCYRAFARVAANKGESAKTRDWFRKAIDLYAMISSRYELAVTRYLAATSGFYENGERAALLYMAKEYFESEDIKPYIEKITKELATGAAQRVTRKPSGDGQPVFIAEDPKTKKILELAENIAASDMTVLLTGPTGSGKDQLARYIHWYSGRKGPLIAVNCAAIPEGMVESELFGYSKGAFTSAQSEKKGLIEMADGGTFYFNEIADTPVQFQAKLLEFLETREIRHLGSTVPKKINVRIIAATNQNLDESMREGKFRADLYHRLNEIPIALASLRERPGDIAPLVRYFLTLEGVDFDSNGDFDGFDDICGSLLNRDWPGNVRQLQAEMKRYYLLARGDASRISALIRGNKQTEREVLLQALSEAGGNQSEAARRLGISEMTVRRRIKDYNFGE